MNKLAVIALGGNAILQPGQRGTAEDQFTNLRDTCRQLVSLVEDGFRLVLTHGNGPQVGNLLIQNAATEAVPALPMDICGAETQGMLGYMFQQTLKNELRSRGLDLPVVSVVTQTVVDAADPAFAKPTKPVGPFYDAAHAKKRIAAGETWIEDAGRGWRKVVPSPDPKEIVEIRPISALVESNALVICVGGGGVPVVREEDGRLRGVEAVIDKDLGGQRLATSLRADVFAVLTDVPGAAINYRAPNATWLGGVTLDEVRAYQKEGHFKSGSMGPKVEACCRFLEAGGELAAIASLDMAVETLGGRAGTRISVEGGAASAAR